MYAFQFKTNSQEIDCAIDRAIGLGCSVTSSLILFFSTNISPLSHFFHGLDFFKRGIFEKSLGKKVGFVGRKLLV